MEKELLPHIDGRYRTLAQREGRGVMGASMGGLISTYLALSRPQLFSKVGGQSSALFLMDGGRASALATDLLSRFTVSRRQWGETRSLSTLIGELRTPVVFYFDVGKYEPQFIPAHRKLVPLLEAKGCPCFFQELIGGHNWTSWRAHLKDLLTFLWKGNGAVANGVAKAPSEELQPPEREAAVLSPDIDRRFVRFFNGWEAFFPNSLQASGWSPRVESVVEGGRLIFRVALPGVDPKDVGVLVLGNYLILKGIRKADQKRDNGNSSSDETGDEGFERVFPLPEGVHADNVTACYHDGVLEIAMPASRQIVAKRIPIEVK
jgi:HSP20 family molecular chaperone IbpA